MVLELTQDEYKSTMPTKMLDVTDTTEAVVDIWDTFSNLKR
jgi:hypothetical protein